MIGLARASPPLNFAIVPGLSCFHTYKEFLMDSSCCSFCTCVNDLDGLALYKPWHLPSWLRDVLVKRAGSRSISALTDEELVDAEIESFGFSPWLVGWGLATINGQEVFVFSSDTLSDPVMLADELSCGVTFVECSDDVDCQYVMYFTQHHACRSRQGAKANSASALPSVV
jgi:hypothetical protein